MKPRTAPRIVSCFGKERMSAARAVKVAGQMRRRHHDGAISAYRCDHCGDWHVGSHSHLAKPLKLANGR